MAQAVAKSVPLCQRCEENSKNKNGDFMRLALLSDIHSNLQALDACMGMRGQKGYGDARRAGPQNN
jgi:hypothetical protein